MKRIIDWYWQHGVNRPKEWTIPPSGLNVVMSVANRGAAIGKMREAGSLKACVAFWGPSQSGKSSLLSHYIDGEGDGNLALSWDSARRVRFSAVQDGGADSADDVVFNPFNGGMDASGLVTRFYLPSDAEAVTIRPESPVEVILADRKQVLQAIAVGYRMECQESQNPWGLDELRKRIAMPSEHLDRDAFEFLFDVCDVCENMSREVQRYREFAKGPKLRQQILGSSCADSLDEAKKLAAYLLWDDEKKLTDLFEGVMEFRSSLEEMCEDGVPRRFFASMEVAALLEDIGVLSFYEQSKNGHPSPEAKKRLKALSRVYLCVTPRGIVFTSNRTAVADKTRAFQVSVEDGFGRLQALVGELRIPLRRTQAPSAKPFFDFLERCDLLDLPGVTNKAMGEATGVENQVDLTKPVPQNELLRRVYKSGKTLSIVYGQAETCSIDSFVIFVDLERAGGVSRPATITSGVKAWLSPYGFTSFDNPIPLKLYFNCSLFGKLMDKVVAAVNGGGLGSYCEKASVLEFATRRDVDCFFTTNQFARCDASAAGLKHYFVEDDDFQKSFLGGHGRESLDALFADGLGTDYMFSRLAADVTRHARFSHYDKMEERDRSRLRIELSRVLPTGEGAAAALRREVVKRVFEKVVNQVPAGDARQIGKLASFVKSVFVVDAEMLDVIPPTPNKKRDEELTNYLLRQLRKWISDRKEELVGTPEVSWLVPDEEIYPFLEALTDFDVARVVQLLKTDFWDHDANVSRTFLATILTNCLLFGDYEREVDVGEVEKYGRLGAPFVSRLRQMAETVQTQAGVRPTDLEGDDEIMEIAKSLQLV